MSSSVRATVLYDAPGPKGRRANRVLTVITLLAAVAIGVWVLQVLNTNGQLESEKWTPFLRSTTWTTYLIPGLWGTLKSAFCSIILALVLGTMLGLGRLSPTRPVAIFCGIIVEFFRAIPVLILMIFAYQMFAVYNVVPSSQLAFSAVVFGLTMYNGSVIAEILRSGIRSLPRGQMEAARALGMSHRKTTWSILLPQSVAAMLPALISQMVIALKDAALGYQIGYIEIVRSGLQSASAYRNYFPALIVVAVIMILINYALTLVAERIERQLRAGRARKLIVAKVPEHADQGVETKDRAVVDWHEPNHRDLRPQGE
ncbi:amino acid ABC transporter permease [Corynebacterium pygosceleis]|uniref:Amino acid ABC transporter permease n=1 Tax=Corynebacterium pygosceleis TaxID=2800406 RepID=A0A9Q4GJY1_9CORY|nr:amino acid ABC transporter permease [Corynebacterium pygosceleis]MCK7636849.1 amino acid ABC transporter permease [Corynebacterium pygosceleis]MCK7674323.1 amino acid ABC transporter permease [Corynebacterium pygosceleis]MCL0120379.1 amino acid ABC transporter permease [Corynebacterium pygosceleis]MCX7443926.1 amino acid ABC transporter permease [Corynebacterium pygosceleis]MCX7467602.1 amino acid ABC transporter permease [Corynebacterium pygosceleis]